MRLPKKILSRSAGYMLGLVAIVLFVPGGVLLLAGLLLGGCSEKLRGVDK